MSFEQKYLKYKQKYQELKRLMQNGGGVHQLAAENYSEDIVLTDTPVNNIVGGSFADNTIESEINLTDTPSMEGGMMLSPASYTPTLTGAETCTGVVNPNPSSNLFSGVLSSVGNMLGITSTTAAPEVAATTVAAPEVVPVAATTAAAAAVAAETLPVATETTLSPTSTASKNRVLENSEFNSTDIEDIQNTEDIERLFNQLGAGHHRRHHSSSSSSSSDSIFSSSSSSSESISDL
jgi:hypothetical protein